MEKEGRLTLDLLKLIDTDAHATQRKMADELGIALGLANSYLKRCIHKGFVKVMTVPANRYAYYLTPSGLAEKSKLVGRYLSYSLQFFRDAKGQCEQAFVTCTERGWRRVTICGTGDLAEIAVLCARSFDMEVTAVSDAAVHPGADAVLLADLAHPQAAYEILRRTLPDDRILALRMLELRRDPIPAPAAKD
jgi:DNA-binding MarR family transcriptional regulator